MRRYLADGCCYFDRCFYCFSGCLYFGHTISWACPAVGSAVDALIFYLGQAMDIVWLFVPKTVTIALMTLAIGVEVVVLGYKFVMWILRKIPMAGIN